jgi:hypothetical protein
MPLDSVICRKSLDEEKGNPWICGCPLCNGKRLVIGDEGKAEMSDPDGIVLYGGYQKGRPLLKEEKGVNGLPHGNRDCSS